MEDINLLEKLADLLHSSTNFDCYSQIKKFGDIVSTFERGLRLAREYVPVTDGAGDMMGDTIAQVRVLSMNYGQFAKKFPAKLRPLLLQLDAASGVERLTRIRYGSFLLTHFIFKFET